MHSLRRYRLAWAVALCLLLALAWAALAPPYAASRDLLFEIPKGTWERRMAGDQVEILPSVVQLTLGVQDVLLLRNSDTVPQQFGPVLIMPGQDFRLPFEQVSENQFACTAHSSGQMTVSVVAFPDPGLGRLKWRLAALGELFKGHSWKN
ncbi:hypothetical protein I4X03_010450 [Massilia sp. R798]|uniref:Uncharacterized protein n=2 Tax=Massilia soli TaxID=2792854 RepID=A0ABS7SPT2_9BURK|nr:hypothetical protein [Massilia soli]